MDLSAGTANFRPRGPLSAEEKARRIATNLYLYYRGKGYRAIGYPKRPKLAVRATTIEEEEGKVEA